MRILAIAVLMVAAAVGDVRAQHGFWQPDDRVLITSFHNATGIATDQQIVFIATSNGLEMYDQTFKRWLPPSTIEDGYPARERPARIAYDPRERGVWLITEAGGVYAWSTAMRHWQQRFPSDVPDDVVRKLQRGSADRDPAWAIMRNFAGRDAAGRTWQVTAIDAGERAGTFWAATNGGNFSFVDTRNLSSEPYSFGTVGRGVSALALGPGGSIWFGGDGVGARTGITRADTALQRWQQYESRVSGGPQAPVAALLATPAGTYAASSDGVYSLRSNRWNLVTDVNARALAHTTGRIWVGARGTLGWIDGTDNYHRTDFPLQSVYSLVARGDTLWIGAETGLYRWANERTTPMATGSQVIDLALTDSGVVTITPRGVQIQSGAQPGLPLRVAALERIGRPLSLHSKGSRLWVGGVNGLAEWNTTTGAWRYLTVPDDIPEGPVYDVIDDNGRIWVATPAGALRLDWDRAL